jgi:hypothetical protein
MIESELETDNAVIDITDGPDLRDLRVLVWKDDVHEEREAYIIQFWRISFGPRYNLSEVLNSLGEMYAKVGIVSHIEYETLGDFDILLRMWVPRATIPEEIENLLLRHLERNDMWDAQGFIGHTFSHWGQLEREASGIDDAAPRPSPRLTAELIDSIAEYNAAQFAEYRARINAEFDDPPRTPQLISEPAGVQQLVSPPDGAPPLVSPISLAARGVRFYITFDAPLRTFTPAVRNEIAYQIDQRGKDVCTRWAERRSQYPAFVSSYVGSGLLSSSFFVMARAPHGAFHKFTRELIIELRTIPLLQANRVRTYTHVIADQMFSGFAESLKSPSTEFSNEDVFAPEGPTLEFKATFSANLDRYRHQGVLEPDEAMKTAVVKSVCGFLNSREGGTLVIGVLEVAQMRRLDQGVLDWLKQTFDYDPAELRASLNLSPDGPPPNAILGVDIEVGTGKQYQTPDVYQLAVQQALSDRLSSDASTWTRMGWRVVRDKRLLVITISPASEWIYAKSPGDSAATRFYVRRGASTEEVHGHEADVYRAANASGRR